MVLLYAEPIRALITNLNIDGQGAEARVPPGSTITIKGKFKIQNPATDPTDTIQLILFREDEFLKCVFNDIPEIAPGYTTGSFTIQCTAPTKSGKYTFKSGWGYNWNWPDQAYSFILANPEKLEPIGVLYVGEAEKLSLLPAILVAIPVVTVIGLAAVSKK